MNETLRKRLIGLAVILLGGFLLTFLIPHSEHNPGHSSIPVTAVPVGQGGSTQMESAASGAAPQVAASAPMPATAAPQPRTTPQHSAPPPSTEPSAPARQPAQQSAATQQTHPQSSPATPPKPTPAPAKPADTAQSGGWYVQVGSYAQESNATTVQSLLKHAGFSCDIQKAQAAGTTVYRVRVGPYASADAAKQAQSRVAKQGYRGAAIISP